MDIIRKAMVGLGRAGAAAMIVLAAAGAAQAKSLKVIVGDGPQHDGTKALISWTAELDTYTDGDLTGRVYPQTLASITEVASALRDGVGDLGLVLYPSLLAEFRRRTSSRTFRCLPEPTPPQRAPSPSTP